MEAIKSYLEQDERDYQQGVALLGQYGKNRQLHANLLRKHTPANIDKLEYELSKLAKVPQPIMTVQGLEAAIMKNVVERTTAQVAKMMDVPQMKVLSDAQAAEGKVLPINADAQYQGLVEQMTQLFNERVKLSNTLEDLESEQQRQETVAKILALQESYNALAEKKNHFDQYGSFPAEPVQQPVEEKVLDLAELTRQRNNLRSRLSKAKAAVAKKPTDVKKQEALAKLEVELNSLELQVKVATEAKERNGAAE